MGKKNAPPPAEEKATVGEASPDPKAAEKAFDAAQPRLLALSPSGLLSQNVGYEKVAVAAAAVGRFVKQKDAHERFASLPKKHFDMAVVEDLEPLALAMWHVAVELKSANAGKSEAKLPPALVEQSYSLRNRMMALAVYHYGDDPKEKDEIDDIKLGTGYEDLASDLQRLSKLYRRHLAYVKADAKNYRAGDEILAGTLAQSILQELGEAKNREQRQWIDLAARAWTLLAKTYEEVAAAGRWLWRNEGGDDMFPSLYAVGRSARSASSKSETTAIPIAPAEDDAKKSPDKNDK